MLDSDEKNSSPSMYPDPGMTREEYDSEEEEKVIASGLQRVASIPVITPFKLEN